MNWKKTLRIVFFALLAIVLLYFSFRGIKWSDFVEGLRTANFYWIGASILVGSLSYYTRAVRWTIMLKGFGKPVRNMDTFDGVGMMYLTNFALPRAGEIARCGVVAGRTGLGFDTVLGSVLIERTFDICCLAVITVLVAIFRMDVFGHFMITQIWNPFINSLGGNTLLAAALCIGIPVLIIVLLYIFRKKVMQWKVSQKIVEFCKGIWKGLVFSVKMPQKGYFFLLTLLMWGLFVGTSYTTILATPMRGQLDIVDALFLMVVGSFGWVVPVQGGIGAYHFILSLALVSVYGMTQTSGMVFATISHESQAVAMLLCGLFAGIHLSMTKKRTVSQ